MEIGIFLKGLIIGLAVSIPLGPMGILCVQRTINHGRYSGFLSGLGAATADTIFAIIAGLGLTFIINFIKEQELYFHLIGGLVLLGFGLKVLRSNPIQRIRYRRLKRNNLAEDFLSVLLITLSNPIAILLFVGVFGGLNVSLEPGNHLQIFNLFTGVFLGAATWWLLLSIVVHLFREKFKLRRIFVLNRVTGGIMMGFGLVAVISIFF